MPGRFLPHEPRVFVERIKSGRASTGSWPLEESKKMTDAQFSAAKMECDAVFHPAGPPKVETVKDIPAKDTSAEEKRAAIEAVKKAEAERAADVKTLAKVPVSEMNQGEDKYDAIDKLTGDAYENAVAKMSDAERAIYAART